MEVRKPSQRLASVAVSTDLSAMRTPNHSYGLVGDFARRSGCLDTAAGSPDGRRPASFEIYISSIRDAGKTCQAEFTDVKRKNAKKNKRIMYRRSARRVYRVGNSVCALAGPCRHAQSFSSSSGLKRANRPICSSGIPIT